MTFLWHLDLSLLRNPASAREAAMLGSRIGPEAVRRLRALLRGGERLLCGGSVPTYLCYDREKERRSVASREGNNRTLCVPDLAVRNVRREHLLHEQIAGVVLAVNDGWGRGRVVGEARALPPCLPRNNSSFHRWMAPIMCQKCI